MCIKVFYTKIVVVIMRDLSNVSCNEKRKKNDKSVATKKATPPTLHLNLKTDLVSCNSLFFVFYEIFEGSSKWFV